MCCQLFHLFIINYVHPVNKVLDCKPWKPVFLTKFDNSQIQHTQVWGWLSDKVIATYQEGGTGKYRLDKYKSGTLGTWPDNNSNNQKFTRVMSGKLGKYDLC